MTQEQPFVEDSFDRARREFFGTVKTTPAPSAFAAEYLKPRNAPLARKVAAPSPRRGWVNPVARSSPHVVSAIDPYRILAGPRSSRTIPAHRCFILRAGWRRCGAHTASSRKHIRLLSQRAC